MNNEGKFGLIETISIVTIVIVSKILFTSESVVVDFVGTAAWYMTLLSCFTSIIFFLILYILMKRFPGKNLIEIFQLVTGKIVGKLLGFLFALYFLYYAGSNLREFIEMIKAYSYPYTATSLFLVTFIIVTLLLSYKGLENIARISYITLIIFIIGISTILLLALPNANFLYLRPYLGYGVKSTLYYGLLRSSSYDEIIILALIIKSVHGLKNFKIAGLISLGIAGLVSSISLVIYLAIFQHDMGAENLSGMFQISRTIYFNIYFQRLESIFLFTWVITSLVTVSIGFYVSISTYCKTFNIADHRPLLLPFSFLMYIIALKPKDISEIIYTNMAIVREYSGMLLYLVPTLVLIIAFITNKRGVVNNEEKA
ncbi:MAG TPA: GerAB/ArcD/ProY family transporter [Clostridiaceae bacterium]